jgi:hypothetical protein
MILHPHRRPRDMSREAWACRRKRRYGRQEAYRKAAQSSTQSGRRIVAYHCEWCGNFHIGRKV